ncbi:MAG: sigma-54 interaction domain-containing protein [Thermodesulfobacteriota bacterium]
MERWNGLSGEQVLEQLGEGVLIIDSQFRIVYFNRRAEQITLHQRQEALGRTCREILRLANCQIGCPVARARREGQSVIDYEAQVTTRLGGRLPVHIRFSMVRDPGGEFSGGIITMRDMPSRRPAPEEADYSFQGILSRNRRILQIFEILPDVSRTDASVLIQGESGTGKELFAAAVHNLSLRQKGPFIKLNCSALPETLLESELFGYVRGAFTDARRNKPGMFQLAHKGTLFLDEIADITPALQVKLLRVLQDGEFIPLGGTQPMRVDVRIISATNRSLEDLVQAGRFRSDLYYRLNVVKFLLPALRERPEDIALLTGHLIRRLQSKFPSSPVRGISPEAMAVLERYDFPGNVRELENIMEHAFIMCKEPMIQPHHLPSYIFGLDTELERAYDTRMREVETRTILQVLRKHHGSKVKAAKELGIHRTTLWRKLKGLEAQRS